MNNNNNNSRPKSLMARKMFELSHIVTACNVHDVNFTCSDETGEEFRSAFDGINELRFFINVFVANERTQKSAI